jgi:hypothetical protein
VREVDDDRRVLRIWSSPMNEEIQIKKLALLLGGALGDDFGRRVWFLNLSKRFYRPLVMEV